MQDPEKKKLLPNIYHNIITQLMLIIDYNKKFYINKELLIAHMLYHYASLIDCRSVIVLYGDDNKHICCITMRHKKSGVTIAVGEKKNEKDPYVFIFNDIHTLMHVCMQYYKKTKAIKIPDYFFRRTKLKESLSIDNDDETMRKMEEEVKMIQEHMDHPEYSKYFQKMWR